MLPELAGKLDGMAVRVPVANVSLVDFHFLAARDTSLNEVNRLIKEASMQGPLQGILAYCDEPLVLWISIIIPHPPILMLPIPVLKGVW